MVDQNRRDLFHDLYRMAEYYEQPPFRPGDIEGNANWFVVANNEQLRPFLTKYPNNKLALDLAMAIVEEANCKAVVMNKM